MKIIFLDIDGVLNNAETADRIDGFTGLDPLLIENFNTIIAAHPDAKIVISSTWRKCLPFVQTYTDFEGLKKLLADRGLKGEIIDHTPIKMSYLSRGAEIKLWLESNAAKALAPIEQFVVIDDDTEGMRRAPKPYRARWMTDEEHQEALTEWGSEHDLREHHVRTFDVAGLQPSKAQLAIDVLNGKLIPLPEAATVEDEDDPDDEW